MKKHIKFMIKLYHTHRQEIPITKKKQVKTCIVKIKPMISFTKIISYFKLCIPKKRKIL